MAISLDFNDLELILESLNYTRKAFEDSIAHPDYQFKQEQLEKVNGLIKKVKKIQRSRIA